MKRVFVIPIILLGLICLNGCSSTPPKGKTQFMGLNGKVKSITERTYRVVDMDGVLAQREMTEDGYKVWKFDTIGDIIESYTWEYGQDYHRVFDKDDTSKRLRRKADCGKTV